MMTRKALICLMCCFLCFCLHSQNTKTVNQHSAEAHISLNTFFQILEISFVTDNELMIYPTQVKDYFNLAGTFKPNQIRVYDLKGRLHYRSHSLDESINLAHLAKGKYILQARDKDENQKNILFEKA